MFETKATQAGEASLDALWLKAKVISNNLANVDTPGFKASTVNFAQVLGRETEARKAGAASNSSNRPGTSIYRTTITEETGTDVRIDGNNVVLEKEQTELWKTYSQYSMLLQRVAGHYSSINTVVNAMRK